MNSIYYGLALLAILLIVHWYVINDGKGQDDGSLGFLAVKKSLPPAKPDRPQTPGKRSFRRDS
jgi:hypothetical protein